MGHIMDVHCRRCLCFWVNSVQSVKSTDRMGHKPHPLSQSLRSEQYYAQYPSEQPLAVWVISMHLTGTDNEW